MAAATKKRCSSCGGFCGGSGRRGGCKFAANEAKRRADELWAHAKATVDDRSFSAATSGGTDAPKETGK
jgi:hypothetical protein